ncbi:hypothetical protein [Streptomyces sp. NPDC058664]|uniref:hypothetical protein n=1 Tax=unclassified Streptomyces TaxID=2593676 RepID=UPI00364AC81C
MSSARTAPRRNGRPGPWPADRPTCDVRARVTGCGDPETLRVWLARAGTAGGSNDTVTADLATLDQVTHTCETVHRG